MATSCYSKELKDVLCDQPAGRAKVDNQKINQKISHVQIQRRDKYEKRAKLRRATVDEIIFIFEKVLEGWRPIKIYNVLIQNYPQSKVIKEDVEHIVTGNCKVYDFENKFEMYQNLREKVYKYHSNISGKISNDDTNNVKID